MKKRTTINIIFYTVLTIGAIVMLLPLIWLFVSTFKPVAEILKVPPSFFPQEFTFQNWRSSFDKLNLWRYLFNTFFVSSVVAICQVLTSAIIGYVFAKFKFVFKEGLFLLIITRMMIPFFIIVIPMYYLILKLEWSNSYQALIVPWIISAFGIFMMRQFMYGIPNELIDAARIDGCSEFGIFRKVVLPISTPALATLGILVFVWEWNQFLWPLLVVTSDNMKTLPVGLAGLTDVGEGVFEIALTASAFAAIPAIAVFIFFQKYLTEGISFTGIKE